MAITTMKASKSSPQHVFRLPSRRVERFFFTGMAVLLCLVVVIGFSPTYFKAGLFMAPLPSWTVHAHGAVFTLWMLLFFVQTCLISARQVRWHRSLGVLAFCLAPIMVVLGTMAALGALNRKVTLGPLDPAVALSIPLLGISCFAVVIFAAWQTRRAPDAHKRLVLLATIGLTGAALGRFPWAQLRIAPGQGSVAGIGTLILLLIAYDVVSLHRIHRSTLWAAPFTYVLNAFAVPIGMTSGWHRFADYLARTVAPYV